MSHGVGGFRSESDMFCPSYVEAVRSGIAPSIPSVSVTVDGAGSEITDDGGFKKLRPPEGPILRWLSFTCWVYD